MERELHRLRDSASGLAREAGDAGHAAVLVQWRRQLEVAVRRLEQARPERPLVVAIIGGTGAGKSELFNALVRKPGASPVSRAERLFTQQLYVAGTAEDRSLAGLAGKSGVQAVEGGVPGVVLVDTPDLDGALPRHGELAREAIELADLLLYVALPEKRSNFVIQEEVKRWAGRKRWFFVLNQVDLCDPKQIGRIREDFVGRIEEAGFEVSDASLFLVCAREPEHEYSELERLRRAVYSSRAREEIESMQELTGCREVAHALTAHEVQERMQDLVGMVKQAEVELSERARQLFLAAVRSRVMKDHLRSVVRSHVWRQVPGKVGGFLAAPLWLMARMNQLWLTFSLSRVLASGGTLGGMLQAATAAMGAYLRGMVPLQALLSAFRPRELEEGRRIRLDAVRKLEDLGLRAGPEEQVEQGEVEGKGEIWNVSMNRLLMGTGEGQGQERVLQALMEVVEISAAESASRAVSRWHGFFGNLLPLVVFIDVSRKAIGYWLEDQWLPGDFYLMSIFLFLLSVVPGCLLVGTAVRARADVGSAEEILATLEEPWETEPLREQRERLERLQRRGLSLQQRVEEQSKLLAAQLQEERFGIGRTTA